MKIVIDIPERKYNAIKKLKDTETSYPTTLELYKAVKDGKPFPKVIDDIKKEIEKNIGDNLYKNDGIYLVLQIIDNYMGGEKGCR